MIKKGQVRWLKADKAEGWSRQRCTVLSDQPTNGTWVVELDHPENQSDDGIREVTEDQFE